MYKCLLIIKIACLLWLLPNYVYSQKTTSKPFKFESISGVVRSLPDSNIIAEGKGYNLIILDLAKRTMNIQPDGLKLDIISKIDIKDSRRNMILSFQAIDAKEKKCLVRILYKDNDPYRTDISYENVVFIYSISKQKN